MSETTNLMECPDCGGTVSRRAASCPHCGAPIADDADHDEPELVYTRSSGARQKLFGGLLMCLALPGCMATGGEDAGIAYGVFVIMGAAGFGMFLTGRFKD